MNRHPQRVIKYNLCNRYGYRTACDSEPGDTDTREWPSRLSPEETSILAYSTHNLRHISLSILRTEMLNSAEMKHPGNQNTKQVLLPLGISEDIVSLL